MLTHKFTYFPTIVIIPQEKVNAKVHVNAGVSSHAERKNPRISCAGRLFRKGFQVNDIDLTPRLFGKLFLKSGCNTWENLSLDSLEKGATTC